MDNPRCCSRASSTQPLFRKRGHTISLNSINQKRPPIYEPTPKRMKTKSIAKIQAERSFSLSRRHFLRGLGACIALPAFESLTLRAAPSEAAQLGVTATGAPLRTAFLFFPNGAIQSAWWPKESQKDFEFSRTLKPLEPLRDQL